MAKYTIILIVALMGCVLAKRPDMAAMDAEREANIVACTASENPSSDDVDLYRNQQIPTSQQGKCFVGCMFEKIGLIQNGAYSKTTADQKAQTMFADHADKLQKVLQENIACAAEVGTGTDKCETGPKLKACMDKNRPSHH